MAYQPKHAGLGITAQLNLKIQDFSKNLSKASSMMSSFAKTTAKQFGDMETKLKRIGISLRDVGRIASGIIISQTFYAGARAISDATGALSEFNEKLDYAHVTYTALFGSADLSSSFLETLKEQSIDTMYSFEDLTQASKKLLAYGIDYKNVAYITEGLGNLAAMSGDTAAMDRIAYALGQVYAKGTLKAEEMRQLANAYVPIQQILKDSFNLTDDQLGNVGDLRIPAEDAINAIVDYANTKFGSVGDAAMLTVTGLKNRITDSFKVIGSEMTQPLMNAYKSFLAWVNNQLNGMREAYLSGGAGGLFEYLVPNENTQQLLRQFFATFANMMSSIMRLVASVLPLVGSLAQGFVTMFNIIQPVLTTLINVLAALVTIVSENEIAMRVLTAALIGCAAAWVLFKAKAVSAVIVTVLTKVIYGIARAVMVLSTVLTKSPAIAILGLLAAGLIALAASSNNAKNALSKLFDSFSGFANGLESEDVLQLKDGIDQTTDSSEDFNNRLEGSGDALDELNKKANEAKKGLLSFDEVFKLNDTKDDTATLNPDLDGILEGLDGGMSFLPEIPDFSEYTDRFVEGLFGDLWESIKRITSGAASGALIGGLVGFAIGGFVTRSMAGALEGAKWGVKIGTIVGAGFATFWGDAYAQMEETLNKIAVTGGVGALVGGLAGMVIAAFATTGLKGKARVNAVMQGGKLGMAIGGLLGAGIGGFWGIAEGAFENALSGIAAGGAAGALVGGLVGMVIGAFATNGLSGSARFKAVLFAANKGAMLGSLLGGAFGGFWGGAEAELKKAIESIAVGSAVGMLIGGLIGMVIGAFATRDFKGAMTGAKWGAAIGGMLGGIFGSFWDSAEEELKKSLDGAFSKTQAMAQFVFASALVGMIVGAIVGVYTKLGALKGAKAGAIVGAAGGAIGQILTKALFGVDLSEGLDKLFNSFTNPSLESIGDVFEYFKTNVPKLLSGIPTNLFSSFFKVLSVFFGDEIEALKLKITGFFTSIKEWFIDDGNWAGIAALIVNPFVGAGILLYNANKEKIEPWLEDLKEKVKTGFDNTKEKIDTWATDTKNRIDTWATDTKGRITTWTEDTKLKITTWVTNTKQNITDWYTGTKSKIYTWYTETKSNINTWATETKSKISTWATETKSKVSTWYTETKSKISTWASETKSKITTWSIETKSKISTWASETKSKLSTWYSETKTGMSNWVTNTKASLKSWWSSIWDPSTWASGWSRIKSWFNTLFSDIKSWFTNIGTNISNWWDDLWDGKSVSSSSYSSGSGGKFKLSGHATGGVFNREHVARFAEGNKAEAIIPLENNSAMQPFVTAVSNGVLSSLMPMLATANSNGYNSDLPPMYVGTLIADDKGLKELERKLKLIRVKEEKRGN